MDWIELVGLGVGFVGYTWSLRQMWRGVPPKVVQPPVADLRIVLNRDGNVSTWNADVTFPPDDAEAVLRALDALREKVRERRWQGSKA